MRTLQHASLEEVHAQKFEHGHAERKRLGLELEFPTVQARGPQLGMATSLEQVKGIFADVARAPGWRSIGEWEVRRDCGGNHATMDPEAGFSTIEISLPPAESIAHANHLITATASALDIAAAANGAYILGVGISPITRPNFDLVCPKDRSVSMLYIYPHLTRENPDEMDWRLSGTVSASLQAHLAGDNADQVVRLSNVLNGLAPELLMLSANSRIAGGVDTGVADLRSMFYQRYTGIPIFSGVAPRFSGFSEYFDAIQNMPVLLVQRDGRYHIVEEDITYKQFAERGSTRASTVSQRKPFEIEFNAHDIDVLESMIRWEARIKGATGTAELRTCTMQQSKGELLGLASVIWGIQVNIEEAERLAFSRTVQEAHAAKERVADYGAKSGPELLASTRRLLDITQEGLEAVGEDLSYHERLYRVVDREETPSERSARIFNEKGIKPFIESMRFDADA